MPMPMIDWTDLEPQVKPLRDRGLNLERLCERLGVSVDTFRRFRRRTGYRLERIKHAKPNMIGCL